MTADELEQIKHRAASCYVGTAWRGAIADVRKLIDAVDVMNLQINEVRPFLEALAEGNLIDARVKAQAILNNLEKRKCEHCGDSGKCPDNCPSPNWPNPCCHCS